MVSGPVGVLFCIYKDIKCGVQWLPVTCNELQREFRGFSKNSMVLVKQMRTKNPEIVTFKVSLKNKLHHADFSQRTLHPTQVRTFLPHFFYSPWCACNTWPFVITSECLRNLGLQKLLLLSRCLCNPTPRSQTATSRHPRPSLPSYRVKTGHFLH